MSGMFPTLSGLTVEWSIMLAKHAQRLWTPLAFCNNIIMEARINADKKKSPLLHAPFIHTFSSTAHCDLRMESFREELLLRSSLRSLASFSRRASSLAYSAASSLFFSARLFLRAMRALLRCSTTGVTRRWILGALERALLPVKTVTVNRGLGVRLLVCQKSQWIGG